MTTPQAQTTHNREISTGYQIVIIAGLIILFLQLFSLAKSLFDNNMLLARIDDFRDQKTAKSEAIDKKQLAYYASLLRNQQIIELKKTKGLVYLDEEEHRLQNSTYMAHKELIAPNEDPIFRDQVEKAKIPTPEKKKIEEISKRTNPQQWMYMLLHIE